MFKAVTTALIIGTVIGCTLLTARQTAVRAYVKLGESNDNLVS